MTDFFKLLYIASIVIWCLPPIKQYGNRLFYFFLILALLDPLAFFYRLITHFHFPTWLYTIIIYICILTTLDKSILKKYVYVFAAILVFFVISIPYQTKILSNIIMIIELIGFLLVFLKNLIVFYVQKKKLNIFYLVLVFYILTNILKYFNLLFGFANAIALFIITSIIQIAFGFFFSIVREDRP